MKIVVLDGYTLNPGDLSWDALKAFGSLTVYDRTAPEDTISRIGDADIVYTNKTQVTRQVLSACPSIRFIGVLATGYNVVDVAAATEKGIPVCNIPTYGTAAVAQFTFALLLEACHHVTRHSDAVKAGRWASCPDFCFWDYPLIELEGKTMGIIGYGRIGRAVAAIARALGMRVVAYDAYAGDSECVPLDTLLSSSDVISLHCPLTNENKGLICAKTIAQMKDGVILLNTSRGPLVNEDDLAAALQGGKVAFAAVDVVSTEPIRPDNPLLKADNCIITPHIAWAPKESRGRLMDIAVDNLRAFLAGSVQNAVKP